MEHSNVKDRKDYQVCARVDPRVVSAIFYGSRLILEIFHLTLYPKITLFLVNMDNIKGSVKETLTKAAAKITKQMSTDDTRDSLAKKSQSQIELRENVRFSIKT